MKRITSVLLLILLLLSLTSCGAKEVEFYDFSGNFSPFFTRTPYDLSVVAQTQETLLVTSGDEAEIVLDGYTEKLGIADIAKEKTDERTVYTIKLGKGICFSDGTPLTARDVIFSMYVYADINYDGWSDFSVSALDGLVNYQYGNENAENITVTDAEAEAELANPSERTKKYITDKIIRPILTEEAAWIETVYTDPAYDGTEAEKDVEKFPESYKLFEYYYALTNSDIKTDGADSMESMLECIISQYGADYKLLGTVYGTDLTNVALGWAKRSVMLDKLGIADDATSSGKIRGIEKIDDYTVKVTVNSTSESQLKDVLGIFVVPFHYYGTGCTENSDGSFTIDIESVKEKSGAPMGAGEYSFIKYKEGKSVSFEKNAHYFREKELEDKLVFRVTGNSSTPTAHKCFINKENVTFTE